MDSDTNELPGYWYEDGIGTPTYALLTVFALDLRRAAITRQLCASQELFLGLARPHFYLMP
jgi:hypothetical protein